jgi:hypothetical protein
MRDILTPSRLSAWLLVPAGAFALWISVAAVQTVLNLNHIRDYLGADFTCYWAAGNLARHGMAASVYRNDILEAAEHAARVMPAGSGLLPFYYPPPYLMLCALLARLPYFAALIVFEAGSFALLALALRRLAPAGVGWLPIVVFPSMLVSVTTGQNGMLSAACFGWFAVLADRRPWLAGACLGALACKPQLAVCAPLALLAAGRWHSLGGAALALSGLCILSCLVFGWAPWIAFLQHLGAATDNITVGILDRAKIMSAFNGARQLGASVAVAGAVQLLFCLPALGALLWFAWRRPDGSALGGAMAAAALLVTPYVMDYDLACLAPALAVGAARGVRFGFLAGDKICLIAAYMLPLEAHDIAQHTHVVATPLMVAALLFVLVRPRQPAPAPLAPAIRAVHI